MSTPLLPASLLLAASLLGGTDERPSWPQWNGPHHDGVSREADWSPVGKEDPLWVREVGLGYSTVVVQDGRLFTMGYDREEGLDVVWCFDALSGEERWTHMYPSEIWNRAHEGGTVNTPTIDGEVLYSLNREGNLYCLDVETGEVRWHTFLKPEENPHGLEYPTWGFSASPVVVDGEMFLNCGRVLKVDRATGKVLWVSEDYGHAYGTPLAFERDGRPLLALLNGRGVAVLSRADGKEVAFREFTGETLGINSATPVLLGEHLFVSSGPLDGNALLALGEGGLEEVWANKEMVNSFSGCVVIGDHLYGYDRKVLKCLGPDGKTRWQVRGIGNGAVSGAGGRILALGEDGEFIVCDASPEEYREHQRVKIFHDEARYWTKPVLVDGIVYCRSSRGTLVALDHRAE